MSKSSLIISFPLDLLLGLGCLYAVLEIYKSRLHSSRSTQLLLSVTNFLCASLPVLLSDVIAQDLGLGPFCIIQIQQNSQLVGGELALVSERYKSSIVLAYPFSFIVKFLS